MFRERLQGLRNIEETTNEKKEIETQTFENFLDKKIVNMYARPWNKLETRLKIIKVREYIKSLCDNKEITQIEANEQIKKLESMIKYNRLKTSNVKYDQEECLIMEIKF